VPFLSLVVAVAALAAPPPCRGPQLAASFSVVRGSAGAGNVVYALRLRNRSRAGCFVSGLARLRLLSKRGRPLPTRVVAAHPGQTTAVRVVLRPGGWASASARFSPDVPGVGEPAAGRRCEPVAYRVRVTPPPGAGATVAAVVPPTSVCEHGQLQLSVLVRGRRPPGT
jgi:hypothetical protein